MTELQTTKFVKELKSALEENYYSKEFNELLRKYYDTYLDYLQLHKLYFTLKIDDEIESLKLKERDEDNCYQVVHSLSSVCAKTYDCWDTEDIDKIVDITYRHNQHSQAYRLMISILEHIKEGK